MSINNYRTYSFIIEECVGHNHSGPIMVDAEKVTYSYSQLTGSVSLDSFEVWSPSLNDFVTIPLNILKDRYPHKLIKLFGLINEKNQERVDEAKNRLESNSIDAWKEKRLGNE